MTAARRLRDGLRRPSAPLALAAVVLIGVPFLARLRLLEVRGFNPDEFEHLHAAYCIAHGQVPYRDFFEHHPPLLPVALAAMMRAFAVDTDANAAIAFVFAARRAMWLLTALALLATWAIARRWRDARVAWSACGLLSASVLFLSKTLEVRPDVPALALALGGVCWALRRDARGARFGSGALLGLAVLCTPKAAFLAAGVAFGIAAERAPRLRRLAEWGAGFGLPLALTGAAFVALGAGRAFVQHNVWLNARWRTRLGPAGVFRELLEQNAPLLILAAAGFAWTLLRPRDTPRPPGDAVVVGGAMGALAGLFVVPVVHRQAALPLLPFLALFAGVGLVAVLDAAAARLPPRTRCALLACLLALLSLAPLRLMAASFERVNFGTLDGLRFVLRNTGPAETVLDGFSGLGTFRPHAFFHFFVHDEIRAMLDGSDRARLRSDLLTGRVVPKIVAFDRHLADLDPLVTAFVAVHYAPVSPEPLQVRLFDNGLGRWRDDGRRSLVPPLPGEDPLAAPHLFAGPGWSPAAEQDGRRIRWARGRRLPLLVPVRGSRMARLALTGRAATAEGAIGLRIGGREIGGQPLAAGWHDYVFELPPGSLSRGLNEIVFSIPEPARRAGFAAEALELRGP